MGSKDRRRKKSRFALVVLIMAVVVAGAASYAYSSWKHSEGLLIAKFQNETGESPELELESALTNEERAKGLMYRHEMAEGHGMIFVFRGEAEQKFWMKDTFIPLDMIFLNADYRIVGILKNVPPQTTEPRTVGVPSQYVVELIGGSADRMGIVNGMQLRFKEEPRWGRR